MCLESEQGLGQKMAQEPRQEELWPISAAPDMDRREAERMHVPRRKA